MRCADHGRHLPLPWPVALRRAAGRGALQRYSARSIVANGLESRCARRAGRLTPLAPDFSAPAAAMARALDPLGAAVLLTSA